MITHYDIKMETQRLKAVLSNEGVNIPPLLQVIKPGVCFFYLFFCGRHLFNFYYTMTLLGIQELMYVLVV